MYFFLAKQLAKNIYFRDNVKKLFLIIFFNIFYCQKNYPKNSSKKNIKKLN